MRELENKSIAPRLVLPPLEPMGLGTGQVESLLSYMARLATESQITLGSLINGLVQPIFCLKPINDTTMKAAHRSLYLCNGRTFGTMNFVHAIEVLTGRNDLRRLTLLEWKDIFAERAEVISQYRRWCPYCIQACIEKNCPVYEPLIWACPFIRFCPVHMTPLEERCANCGCDRRRSLSFRQLNGFCSKCVGWLGKNHNGFLEIESAGKKELDMWVSEKYLELFNHESDYKKLYSKDNFLNAVRIAIKVKFAGNLSEFSRHLGCGKSLVCEWLNGKAFPRPDAVGKIAYVLQTPINLLYSGDVANSEIRNCVDAVSRKAFRCPRKPSLMVEVWRKAERLLIEIANDRNLSILRMEEVGFICGVDASSIRRKFPELSIIVHEKCKVLRNTVREIRLAERIQKDLIAVEMAAKKIIKKGRYPSLQKITAELQQEGYSRHRRIQKIVKEVQRKLLSINPKSGVLKVGKH